MFNFFDSLPNEQNNMMNSNACGIGVSISNEILKYINHHEVA